jgi:hypothetical protein
MVPTGRQRLLSTWGLGENCPSPLPNGALESRPHNFAPGPRVAQRRHLENRWAERLPPPLAGTSRPAHQAQEKLGPGPTAASLQRDSGETLAPESAPPPPAPSPPSRLAPAARRCRFPQSYTKQEPRRPCLQSHAVPTWSPRPSPELAGAGSPPASSDLAPSQARAPAQAAAHRPRATPDRRPTARPTMPRPPP